MRVVHTDTAKISPAVAPMTEKVMIDPGIFRAYDIRGVVGETLDAAVAKQIGRAIGTLAMRCQQGTLAVGRDGRESGPALSAALIEGLRMSGCDVIDVGMVPTPVLYFATHFLKTGSGVMVTGSHNPRAYNGFKVMLAGNTLSGDEIQMIYQQIDAADFSHGAGGLRRVDVSKQYIQQLLENVSIAAHRIGKIVVDAGNGVVGPLVSPLFSAFGCEVVELYCDVDGRFPNHPADPSQPAHLQDLIDKVKEEKADIGLAFDGDGDRIGVVDGNGHIIWPDRQLMLLAKDVLTRHPGATILFDVKCSRYLSEVIEAHGGRPLMCRTGHSFIKKKMQQMQAPLAGEMSGHIFFKERWYGFDDALYVAARILEQVANTDSSASALFATIPEGVSTPEMRIALAEDKHAAFMAALGQALSFDDVRVIDIDGFRVEFAEGWGLIRASNTTKNIIVRFEAESAAALARIQDRFRALISKVDTKLIIPF